MARTVAMGLIAGLELIEDNRGKLIRAAGIDGLPIPLFSVYHSVPAPVSGTAGASTRLH